MIISIFSLKGGVGKTPLAFTLAKDLDLNLQSNDNSVIETIYKNRAKIGKPVLAENTVYDFGGFADTGILPIIEKSNALIIPCTPDYNSILRTVETLEAVKGHNDNILIAVTKTEKEDEFLYVVNSINEFFDDLNFFELRNSKIFKNSIETGKSLTELYNETPLSKNAYRTIYKQYLELLELFK
ncbi:MAG: ParA family protein [Bacilli bacterium]|nr:ParA family protein [Bacilli bacterium]